MSPEEKARLNIDKQLEDVGYVIHLLKMNQDRFPRIALGELGKDMPMGILECHFLIF